MRPEPYLALAALLLTLLAGRALTQPADGAADGAPAGYGRVGYLPIDGPIDRVRYTHLRRALARAERDDVDTLIVAINTDGGEVFYAREMLKLILEQKRAGRRTVALVDYRAISAGALIAYGHQQIYISDTATIGDIGVIFVQPGEGMRFASEKIETVIRALLAQAAEQNGWPRGLLLKMTARNQTLYRVNLPDGGFEYVIQDDLPEYLAARPQLDKNTDTIVYRGSNRLLTLTGREALSLGMATGIAADADALYRQLGIDPTAVVDFRPDGLERLAGLLAGWAPLLAGLALLFVIFELKTPGVGLWALLGAGFGALFLIAQYTLDLIDYLEIILILLGLTLLLVELLTVVGGGLIGLAGATLTFVGLVLAFLPNEFEFDIDDPQFVDALAGAGLRGLFAIAVMTAGVVFFIVTVPKSRLGRRMAVETEISADSGGRLERSAAELIGRRGVCRDALRPGGVVLIDGRGYSARARHGAALEAGQAVTVEAVEFGELIVAAADDGVVRESGEP